MTKWKFA